MSPNKGFSILVPAFNEEDCIEKFLQDLKLALKDTDKNYEIIVIDDGSKDKTFSIASGFPDIRVVRHPYNKGYGASIKTGVQEAVHEQIVTIDADGQHDPIYIPEILKLTEKYDLVAGARHGFISGKRGLGNKLLAGLASYLSNIKVPDLTCGLRAFTKDKFSEFVHIFPNKSSLPSTTILAFATSGYNVKFFPISDQPRQGGVSKVRIVKDGMRFFMLIIRLSSIFNPLKVFAPMSAVLFFLAALWAIRTLSFDRGLSPAVAMLFMGGVFVFMFGLLADQIAQTRLTLGKMDKRIMKQKHEVED